MWLLLEAQRNLRSSAAAITMKHWTQITSELNDAHGLGIEDPSSVRSRVLWLLEILHDPTHDQYTSLVDHTTLHDQVNEYHQYLLGRRGNAASRRRRRSSSSSSTSTTTRDYSVNKPRAETSTTSTSTSATDQASVVAGEEEKEEEQEEEQEEEKEKKKAVAPTKTQNGPEEADYPTRGKSRSAVHALADERLMRQLLERAPVYRAKDQAELWHLLVSEFPSGRFPNGASMAQRVSWLLRVRSNNTHREWHRLTPALHKMLAKCVKHQYHHRVRDREEAVQLSPEKAGPVSTARLSQDSSTINEPAPSVQRMKPRSKAKDDEKLMELVLKSVDEMMLADRELDAWEEIADASKGRFVTGPGARQRLQHLLKASKDPRHKRFPLLSKKLRLQLVEYESRVLSGVCDYVLEPPGSPSDEIEDTTSLSVSVMPLLAEETVDDDADLSEPRIYPVADVWFVRYVTKKLDALTSEWGETEAWEAIGEAVRAVRAVHHVVHDGASAAGRFRWLIQVHQTPTHPEHGKLKQSLRSVLSKYLARASTNGEDPRRIPGDEHSLVAETESIQQ